MLRQHEEETRLSWQHTPPASSASGPRFDKDTAVEILETAARLQTGEQETLTQAEIEAFAQEMGIEPRHVRQAIVLSGRQTGRDYQATRLHLSRSQKRLTLFVPLVYSLYMVALVHLTWSTQSDLLVGASLYCLPLLLSLWLGVQLRYKRAGALAGLWVIAALVWGVFVGIILHEGHPHPPTARDLQPLLWMLFGAVASGTVGAALRQWRDNHPLLFSPSPVRPANTDR